MSDVSLATSDGPGVAQQGIGPQWGIFANGAAVVTSESVRGFSYKQDWPISTYQIEQGGFETYDKVQLPFEPRVVFSTGGDATARQALLDSIDAIAGDTNLYDVVTPEKVYLSANITRYDYDRNEGVNAGILKVSVYLLEIRIASSASYNTATPITNAQSPSAMDQVNNGTAQTDVPSSAPNIGTGPILPANFTSMTH